MTTRIGHLGGDRYDPRCAWLRHRRIGADGAVLLPPDRFIARRSLAGAGEPEATLADALSPVLAGRPARRPRQLPDTASVPVRAPVR